MMPNVVRGDRMGGLLRYLAGPGRANEHEEPHLVAGDPALVVWHGDAQLGRVAVRSIARHLDRPRTAFRVEVPGGHVWHCSLSLRADEGTLTDERWGAIAYDFIAAMAFDDVGGTMAPCRWIAVRHGVSKHGNDHIHVAVNLVREDGAKASIHNDFHRTQNAARALEVKYGLARLESVSVGRSTRGYDPAEREAQATARARAKYERSRSSIGRDAPAWAHLTRSDRQGRIAAEQRADQPRHRLARTVRASAAVSESEAEFVRRLRRSGILVRPRYADDRADVVTGYAVAGRPEAGERPIWYGGGRLGRDLTLPRLREGWPDIPTGAPAAAAEWNAAKRARRVVDPGRETSMPEPELWQWHAREVSELRERLRDVPLDDWDTWSTLARQTAGAFAAWSNAVEDEPGDLAAASDALARSAQTFRRPVSPKKTGPLALSGVAMLLASGAAGPAGRAAQAIVLRQLVRLSQAVYDAARAAGDKRQADLILSDVKVRMDRLRRDLAPPPATQPGSESVALDPAVRAMLDRIAVSQSRSATEVVSPVRNQVEPGEYGRRSQTKPAADRSPER